MSKALVSTLQRNLKQALSNNRLLEARDILARLQKEDPLSRETRGFELEYYLTADRLGEAEALASQLCRMFPDSARIWMLAGKVAYRQKRYAEADSCFHESHRLYPSEQTKLWMGKTLTQIGRFEEAESLLTSVRARFDSALLDLGWLYERKGELDAAIEAYDSYLALHPGNDYATKQRIRLKARALDPESLIEEVERREEFGEQVPGALYAEYIEKLLQTGNSRRAREEVRSRLEQLDSKSAVRIAWSCYRLQVYDLACDLFIRYIEENASNFKYLTALESAASKCSRLGEIIEAYKKLAPSIPKLYGRIRSLAHRVDDGG